MPGAIARRPAEVLAVLGLLLVACGSPAPTMAEPWSEPADGAVAVTEWVDDGEPGSPFGPGGAFPWSGPEQILESMAGSMVRSSSATVRTSIVGVDADGATIGWVRLSMEGADPLVAAELRLEMRSGDGSWHVAGIWSREHCRHPLTDGRCEGP